MKTLIEMSENVMKWAEGPKDGMQTARRGKNKNHLLYSSCLSLLKGPGDVLRLVLWRIVCSILFSPLTSPLTRSRCCEAETRARGYGGSVMGGIPIRAERWEFDGWGASRTVWALYGPWWSLSGQYFLYIVTALLILLRRFNHAPLLA